MPDDNRTADSPALRPETLTAHAGHAADPASGAVVPPLQPSTTYQRRAQDYELVGTAGYSRDHNPTYEPVETLLTQLEGGAVGAVFSSGLGAAVCLIQALNPGDHIIAQTTMYWGLRQWLEDFSNRWGLQLDLVDTSDLAKLEAVLRPGKTKLVWLETPANPLWNVVDIAGVVALAKAAGSLVAVDNTVATPVLTRPLELGADFVMHSATKYLNGHSDVLAGALVAAEDNVLWQRVLYNRSKLGAVLGPFEAWLLLRGMRTLFLRVRQASASALAFARHFEGHPKMGRVLYPGLPGHPGHEIASKQMIGGFSGMMSLRLASDGAGALKVAQALRLFLRATSLGGVESLVEHRATIEGGKGGPVPEDLLRISIGIEAPEDLIADMEQALATL